MPRVLFHTMKATARLRQRATETMTALMTPACTVDSISAEAEKKTR